MKTQEVLAKALESTLKGVGGLINSRLIHKTEQPYLEGEFLNFNAARASLELKVDDKAYEFPIEYFESAYVPRPGTKLFIFPEMGIDTSGLKIFSIQTDMQLTEFAPMYQFKPLKLSKFDDAVLFNPHFGRLSCQVTDSLREKIGNREITENETVLVKVIQAGSQFFLIPMIGKTERSLSNDFERFFN